MTCLAALRTCQRDAEGMPFLVWAKLQIIRSQLLRAPKVPYRRIICPKGGQMVSAPEVAFRTLLATVSLLAWATSASAWTPYGHMVIAASAYDQLDSAARERVDALIRLNRFYPDWTKNVPAADVAKVAFVKAATWADEIKGDHDYHDDEITGPEAKLKTG